MSAIDTSSSIAAAASALAAMTWQQTSALWQQSRRPGCADFSRLFGGGGLDAGVRVSSVVAVWAAHRAGDGAPKGANGLVLVADHRQRHRQQRRPGVFGSD